ncbi:MAG: ABC transporter permease [Anaerolineae bacterium]|nr:ABC transporter permease [Anaerolineae bacterium]
MRFLTRRIGFYAVAALIAITLNFLIPRMMTGDPVSIMFARFQGRLEPRALESLKIAFGFVDGPLLQQYVTYLQNLAQGNLGISVVAFPVPVTRVIATGLGWTLRLAVTATIISFALGTLLGIYAAWRRGRFADQFILPALSLLGAFPYFFIAMLALYIFALDFGWVPLNHASDLTIPEDWSSGPFLLSVIHHAILPATTIVITSMGGWMLGMRNNMIGVLSQDFIVMAQAKGLRDRRVMFTYAARNAILPSLTGFAMSLGFVVGGALVTEIVFNDPGSGYLLLNAVNSRDYPLMQGIFLMITLAVLLANLIVDIVYVLLDPRAR